MNIKLAHAASKLIERASAAGLGGVVASGAQLQRLDSALDGGLPGWYAELLSTYPLCGLELGWHDEEESDDEAEWMIWSAPDDIRSEAESSVGSAILERGYINIALSAEASGDAYFIPTDKGEDPPIYQIDRETGDDADEILAEGLRLVATSLSDFFNTAKLESP